MPVPYDYFAAYFGVALMHYNHSTADWNFVCWSSKRAVVRDLGVGGHTFQLWLIVGGSIPGVLSVRHNAWVNISVIKNRK